MPSRHALTLASPPPSCYKYTLLQSLSFKFQCQRTRSKFAFAIKVQVYLKSKNIITMVRQHTPLLARASPLDISSHRSARSKSSSINTYPITSRFKSSSFLSLFLQQQTGYRRKVRLSPKPVSSGIVSTRRHDQFLSIDSQGHPAR